MGCSLGAATAALASAAAAPAPASVLAVTPAEEAAARRVMSLPRPDKRNMGATATAVSKEINCDLEDECDNIAIARDVVNGEIGVDLVGGSDSAMVGELHGWEIEWEFSRLLKILHKMLPQSLSTSCNPF